MTFLVVMLECFAENGEVEVSMFILPQNRNIERLSSKIKYMIALTIACTGKAVAMNDMLPVLPVRIVPLRFAAPARVPHIHDACPPPAQHKWSTRIVTNATICSPFLLHFI